MKQINVVDCRETPLESTYRKRARQLVKQQRAEWISGDTIRMKLQYVEESIMATENMIPKESDSAGKDGQAPDDETILELAKRRLAIKKDLFCQIGDYMLILLCFALFAIIWDYERKMFIGFTFLLFWGGRLSYRILKFAKPSFKDGISAYLKKRNDYKLESEFNRLKKEYLREH